MDLFCSVFKNEATKHNSVTGCNTSRRKMTINLAHRSGKWLKSHSWSEAATNFTLSEIILQVCWLPQWQATPPLARQRQERLFGKETVSLGVVSHYERTYERNLIRLCRMGLYVHKVISVILTDMAALEFSNDFHQQTDSEFLCYIRATGRKNP